MTPDPFVAAKPDCSYVVRSLYYDDPAFTSYYQKVEGNLQRAKFRLRTYTSDPREDCSIYLEIKGRYNALVFKHRVGLTAIGGSRRFANCTGTTDEILATINDSPVADQFRYDLVRKHIAPIMLIDYIRRPYFSRHDPDFRVTLDEQLHGTLTDRLFPSLDDRRMLLPGCTVMEIKFKDRIPFWFHRLITNYNLKRHSISKVCKGMEAWNVVAHAD
jgi:hypothetical protein